MRMIVDFDLPIEPFNGYVKDGSVGERIQKVLDHIGPEAAYFSEAHGKRGGFLVVDVEGPSDVPRIAEPLFLQFDAEVRLRICMTPEDLAHSGLDEVGRRFG